MKAMDAGQSSPLLPPSAILNSPSSPRLPLGSFSVQIRFTMIRTLTAAARASTQTLGIQMLAFESEG